MVNMQHNQRGYILVLLFGILSLCMSLMSLFFSRTVTYQHLMHLLTQKDLATKLALSSTELGQAIFYVPSDYEKKESSSENNVTKKMYPFQKMLRKIFPYLNTNTSYKLSQPIDGIDATINIYTLCESGKININSLFDIRTKKFFNEGKDGDRKKFCEWLFEKISKITKKPSLCNAFEQHLKKRSTEFNDTTELLDIPDFAEVFKENIFFNSTEQPSQTIFLTDIFTIATNAETINPWFFSHSWRIILDLPLKNLSTDEQKKLVESFKNQVNWEVDWNTSLRTLYQKEYNDLPKEIKSLLTTECEANIFSLLLSATIGETTATIFTILKKQASEKSQPFDMVKIYQI